MNSASSVFVTIASTVVLSLAGCAASDAPQPAAATATTAAAPVAGTYVTPQNSKIEWTGSKVSAHHDGAFTSFTGKIELPGAVEHAKISVDIDTASLVVNDPSLGPMVDKLMGHLKSPDFFDVAKFAKASFTSTAITPGGGSGTYTVTGPLTIHGVTKEISFPATVAVSGSKVDATATFNINRRDYGLVYPGKPDDAIKDDVQVRLTVHADKQ